MIPFARTDNSVLSRWWWTVDRWTLAAVPLLALAGLLVAASASLPTAERLGQGPFYFVSRQSIFAVIGLSGALLLSLFEKEQIKRIALFLLIGSYLLVLATLVFGPERQGAARWLSIAGFSLQPSEFLKPTMAVTTAWILSARYQYGETKAFRNAALLLVVCLIPLAMQPDIGQSFLIASVWSVQLFLAGAPLMWFVGLAVLGIVALSVAYNVLPYVAHRIQIFIDPTSGDAFQLKMSLAAFRNGGLFGTGPSGGEVKRVLPDAYADYIFAVVGEEFGLVAALLLIGIFLTIVVRSFARLLQEEDPFSFLAVAGMTTQFGLQAFINMAVNLGLMPPKGMTLPFVSYGGSSMLGLCVLMGFILALSRRNRFLQGAQFGNWRRF
ncbi:MAG: putative peptidoglycan glycosyltransferase FtsW [Sphingomonadales bacterium]|jgi:cell division protein FtsW